MKMQGGDRREGEIKINEVEGGSTQKGEQTKKQQKRKIAEIEPIR